MTDPRRLDLIVRSVTTALIALIIVIVAAAETWHTGKIPTELGAWGAIIIGVYFGAHTTANGSAIRAARDQQMTEQLLTHRAETAPAAPDAPPAVTNG